MPTRITLGDGSKQSILKEEEEKLLCQLMGELKFTNVDFMITKMVIYNWPKGDIVADHDAASQPGVNINGDGPVETDEKAGKEGKESLSPEELENKRYLSRLSKWRNCIKTDNFCYRYAVGSCYQQNKPKECKSLIGVIRKHNKSFNIEQLYNNGDTTIKNKRRAFYLAHYLSDYCGMNNSYIIKKFNEMIINDKHYHLLKINYKNTSLWKKEKRMRRKINCKKNKSKKGGLSLDNQNNKNNVLSSLMEASDTQPLNEMDGHNKLSSVGVLSTSTDQFDGSSVIIGSDNSMINTYTTTTDDIDSNGDSNFTD